jgi:haloacetate dehalogenase
LFDGFTLERIDVGDAQLRVRYGGSGPPVLLLHGHPRTHTTWHRVAPILGREFTVVCPDLRGYGASSKPVDEPDHAQMSKRALGRDCVALMEALGHPQFAVAGHDRGTYVAARMALDAPDRVSRLVVMDGIPIGEALRRADARFASKWWHWFYFGQTAKPAERVINLDPDEWYGGDPEVMGRNNHEDFREAIRDPETVHAMLEDYRAGLTVDRATDDADRSEGRRITCPTLFLWSTRDDLHELYTDPLAVWRDWTVDLRGLAINSGHHMAEEAPEALAAAIGDFLRLAETVGRGGA